MSNKNNYKLGKDYRLFKRKIIRNTILMVFIACFIVWILYKYIFFGHFANFMVWFLKSFVFFKSSNPADAAYYAYQSIFRNNLPVFFGIAISCMFILILWFYLNFFISYFREISNGVRSILNEDVKEVTLSKELENLQSDINSIKTTLNERRIEAELAEKKKNDLIVYLAHDLKTPLTSVIGYLTLLEEAPDLSLEKRAQYTGIAKKKAERLEELINEFFDITRFSYTKMILNKDEINLSMMLYQEMSEFEPVLREKGMYFSSEIEKDVTFACDADKIARVFDNLIRNAVNYSYRDSELFLKLSQDEGNIYVELKNHGNTIPEEKLEHLFDQFYRVDSSRGSQTGGAGLGLAIAKEIVTHHGGTIRAFSENEEIKFFISFPK